METSPDETVRTGDGLDLAVYEEGDGPTVVLVHGYPDDHSVWDGVAALLAERLHVVRYDVRGSGASETPRSRSGYAMARLAEDLRTVIDATSPSEAVHLVGHDWGSVQAWEAVTDPAMRDRLRSFTSISGPSVDMAGAWLRDVRAHPGASLQQLLASSYIFAFQLPVLPELAARSGVLDVLINRGAALGVPAQERAGGRRPLKDLVNGLELYRANMMGRLARPGRRSTTVPTQVIAPLHDIYVTVPLQTQAPAPYCTDLHTRTVDGNHWVVAQEPALIAGMIEEFVRYAEGGPLPAGLTRG